MTRARFGLDGNVLVYAADGRDPDRQARARHAIAAAATGRFSYWDALLLATLGRAGCSAVLSGDTADGASLAGATVRNPFAGATLPAAVAALLA